MIEQPINRNRLIDFFLELLHYNAPSRREGAIAEHLSALLRELGAEVVFDNAGKALNGETGNLIARFRGTADGPALLFCAHLDTVTPTDKLRVEREDGVIRSDGNTILGADDRVGIAAIIEMLRALTETDVPHPPLEIVFTVAEEVGVMGSMYLDYSQLTARYGFVADSSGKVGAIVTRAPAQKHLHVTVKGRAAHAGMAPEQGINAIAIASRAIARMRQGRIDDETTANIGTIKGGKATNIISEFVEIEGEARSRNPRKLDEQVAHMRLCFLEEAELAGGSAEVEISDVYPSFNIKDDCLTVHLARQAFLSLGGAPVVSSTGGGSDANFFNGNGIEAVILSTGYHNPHGTNEYTEEDELVLLAEWLFKIVQKAVER